MSTDIKLKISNLALDTLQQEHITGMDSTKKAATLCNDWFDIVFDTFLRTYAPQFSIKKQTIYYNEAAKGYQLPADAVIVVNCSNDEFTVNGDLLRLIENDTSNNQLEIEYVSNDLNLLLNGPTSAHQIVAFSLAAKLAFPLTKDGNLSQVINGQYRQLLIEFNFTNQRDHRPSRIAQSLINNGTWTSRGRR